MRGFWKIIRMAGLLALLLWLAYPVFVSALPNRCVFPGGEPAAQAAIRKSFRKNMLSGFSIHESQMNEQPRMDRRIRSLNQALSDVDALADQIAIIHAAMASTGARFYGIRRAQTASRYTLTYALPLFRYGYPVPLPPMRWGRLALAVGHDGGRLRAEGMHVGHFAWESLQTFGRPSNGTLCPHFDIT